MQYKCYVFSYRMESTMDKDVLRIPNPQRQHVIRDRLICAVIIHRRAFLFCEILLLNLRRSLLFLIVIGVVSLSINLFRLLKAITAPKEIIEIMTTSFVIFFHFFYMFLGNLIGQQITNINAEIFNIICNLPWYTASLSVQKLLLFLLQKNSKNFYISLGGILDASYESFTMLSKLSVSYFSVLHAIQ
ncbi:uncharacterized protein LOC112589779 isoform X2 [Harpegnathos saltator]|uniref:uncharacterized protein LOC112589779 isoform X2 n=1 Tax=Harpegnathos saltator TaxID=610380 RepID=UPI000DBED24C|nr:uncharacterized protein LOC112589779 isoform X2 [Harpegnathos saltator]